MSEQDGVAIRRRLHDPLRAKPATRAAHRLDDDRLAQILPHGLGDNARQYVRGAARSNGTIMVTGREG